MKAENYRKRREKQALGAESKESTRSVIVRIPESVLAQFEKYALADKGLSAGLMVRTMIFDYNKSKAA